MRQVLIAVLSMMCVLAYIAVPIAVIYVLYHFITKYW